MIGVSSIKYNYIQIMINRTLKGLSQVATHAKQINYFSTHHEATPTKLSKVEQIVINLYIKNRYGMVEKVPAFVGQSLLEAITRMKVHAYNKGHCNGFDSVYRPHFRPHDNDSQGPQCGQCRVVLEDNWFKRVQKQTDGYNEMEELLLFSSALDLKSNSRLACCVPVEAWMEGLTCSVDIDPLESEQPILI